MTELTYGSPLLALVTGTNAAIRCMENISSFVPVPDVPPQMLEIFPDYEPEISIGGEDYQRTMIGYADWLYHQEKEPRKVTNYFADNRTCQLYSGKEITTELEIPGFTPDLVTKLTKDTHVTEGTTLCEIRNNRVDYSMGKNFLGSDLSVADRYSLILSAVSGVRGNPAAVAGSGSVSAVKVTEEDDIRRMQTLAGSNSPVQIIQNTIAPDIKIEFTGPIMKEADVDQVTLHLETILKEQIAAAPEGVYR